MPDLIDLTLSQMSRALRAREVSSRELALAFLERIDRLDPQLHAFLTLTPETALEQADAADRRLNELCMEPVREVSPLLGVPVAVKDVLSVAGVRCTCGSRILENYISPFNATAVERLLASGVVILG